MSLIAIAPATLLTRAAELSLQVVNEDTNQSNSLMFRVENGPLITRISRRKVRSGIGAIEIEVGGVTFSPEMVLYASNVALAISYINDAFIKALIPAEMTQQPGVLHLQARNPDGGRSNVVSIRVH